MKKDIRQASVGDLLEKYAERRWTDNVIGKSYVQKVRSIIEITEMHHNRFEYKTVEILEAKDVCSLVTDLLDIKGGAAFRAFDVPLKFREFKLL